MEELPPCALFAFHEGIPSKQECDAPQAGKSNKGIDQTAEQGALSSKKPGYQIKLGDADQSPVDAAYNGQNQCNGIHEVSFLSSFGYH